MVRAGIVLVAALCVLAAPLAAQGSSDSPGGNRYYQSPDFYRWQAMFESEGREVFDKRQQIVAALDIRPGMTVADVGAGTGVFSVLFARIVGDAGVVLAQDVADEFVRGIASRASREKLPNVRTVLGGEKDARLPPASVDLVFVCDTYHHFEYPQAMLASLHAALKPGGRLAVIDYEKIPGRSGTWVMGHVRAGRETVIAEIEAAGFRRHKSHALLRENFFVEFVRQ
ncbi:class I SAM-dependent methyltransferase [Sulfurisoma sediminicola]|uniref:Methyltransferase family protein n=1 Tax=Sulfurisoma sediminicola TaxID=1381557 RepID=A0A497XKI7_9PROT|nr:methyltransferase domain-containing protein [Sulfurisoma sediminicola]RLJ68451.1 methyltransferase family protein [Sulfurisoma sediminicola]